jgi:hypothetical protein
MRFLIITLLAIAFAQPPSGGGNGPPPTGGGTGSGDSSGGSSASSCSADSSSCDGSDGTGWTEVSGLAIDQSTGMISGEMISNGCPTGSTDAVDENDNRFMPTVRGNSESCTSISVPSVTNTPAGAELLGNVGYSFRGANIYGPFEAGFSAGMACAGDNDTGDCAAGSDVPTCIYELDYECSEGVDLAWFDDACGGHASPYHLHMHAACAYDACDWSSHSPAIGFALDGRLIYGMWESQGTMPVLDQCNGHTGDTPGSTVTGVGSADELVIPAMTGIYHYHMSGLEEPFTIGCFGPVSSLQECYDLYDECGDDSTQITVKVGEETETITYDIFCPCWEDGLDLHDDNKGWIESHCGSLPDEMTSSGSSGTDAPTEEGNHGPLCNKSFHAIFFIFSFLSGSKVKLRWASLKSKMKAQNS